MTLGSATRTVSPNTRQFRPRACPLCNSLLLAPEATGFHDTAYDDDSGRVQHVWSCDDCGYAFCTAIEINGGSMVMRRF